MKIVVMVLSMGMDSSRRFYDIDEKKLLDQAEQLKSVARKRLPKMSPLRRYGERVKEAEDQVYKFEKFKNACHSLARKYGYPM